MPSAKSSKTGDSCVTTERGTQSIVPFADRTAEELAESANGHHAECMRHAADTFTHAVKAGQYLLEAKKKIGHGSWESWLATNCKPWASQALRYMKLAREFGDKMSNPARAPDLPRSIRQAFSILADSNSGTKKAAIGNASHSRNADRPGPSNGKELAQFGSKAAKANRVGNHGDDLGDRQKDNGLQPDHNASVSAVHSAALQPVLTPAESVHDSPAKSATDRIERTDQELPKEAVADSGMIDPTLLAAVQADASAIAADVIEAIRDARKRYCRRKPSTRIDAIEVERAILVAVRRHLAIVSLEKSAPDRIASRLPSKREAERMSIC
jgi:DUF3102 family protein